MRSCPHQRGDECKYQWANTHQSHGVREQEKRERLIKGRSFVFLGRVQTKMLGSQASISEHKNQDWGIKTGMMILLEKEWNGVEGQKRSGMGKVVFAGLQCSSSRWSVVYLAHLRQLQTNTSTAIIGRFATCCNLVIFCDNS